MIKVHGFHPGELFPVDQDKRRQINWEESYDISKGAPKSITAPPPCSSFFHNLKGER
ncbi:hypothetical protein N9H45_03575 [Opitutales bacterium]|nr:hypothetical protein [Opitutales bacterium]